MRKEAENEGNRIPVLSLLLVTDMNHENLLLHFESSFDEITFPDSDMRRNGGRNN